MKMYRRTVVVAVVMLSLAGCATNSPPESGFLTDYSGLVRDEGERRVWVYHNPKTTYAEYQRVILDPFVVGFGPNKSATLVHSKEISKLADYMRESVAKTVAEHYPVVEKPGKGTLRLRLALTHLEPSTGADSSQAGSGWMRGIEMGGASFEGETCDSVTGERIHAFIATDQTGSASTGRWSQAIAVMDNFGKRFREELDKAHGRH